MSCGPLVDAGEMYLEIKVFTGCRSEIVMTFLLIYQVGTMLHKRDGLN